MGFMHIKELRQHCRELKRDFDRANRAIEDAEPDSKEERAAMRWMARIEKDIVQIEKVVDILPEDGIFSNA